jgi:hypothetical protein
VVALAVAARAVSTLTGAFVPLATMMRVLVAIAALVVAGVFLPRFGRLLMPVVATGFVCAYVGMLIGTRELTKADLTALRSLRS